MENISLTNLKEPYFICLEIIKTEKNSLMKINRNNIAAEYKISTNMKNVLCITCN